MTTSLKIESEDMPGLHQSASQASMDAQFQHFGLLGTYLALLVIATCISFAMPKSAIWSIVSAAIFLATLGILIFLRVQRPDDIWYNGRAVAESVKTRAWRWMMRADPYAATENESLAQRSFIADLKSILAQNGSLSKSLQSTEAVSDPVSSKMLTVRAMGVAERLAIYVEQRVQDQIGWYWKKSKYNKKRAQQWFWASVVLHSGAIAMLLLRIRSPECSLPIEVVATAAGAVLTWLQAKKHNELNSAYALTAHEISLIKGESPTVDTEADLSEYVLSSETAFSREHTQWVARKSG